MVSACDYAQKEVYEKECERLEVIYSETRFCTLVDEWNGQNARIGSGGSLLQACKVCLMMGRRRVLLTPAGGYSKRLPHVSKSGKAMLETPCGKSMLELKYLLHNEPGPDGILVVGSDTIELMPKVNMVTWPDDAIVAYAHPSTLEVGTGHGVFVLQEEGEGLRRVDQFLHKPSMKDMEPIARNGKVWTDSCFWVPWKIVERLAALHDDWQAMDSVTELEAYGDFLQALRGVDGWCSKADNLLKPETIAVVAKMRRRIAVVLENVDLYAFTMLDSRFIHIGTTREYLHHLSRDEELLQRFGWPRGNAEGIVFNWHEGSVVAGRYRFVVETGSGFAAFDLDVNEDFKKIWDDPTGCLGQSRQEACRRAERAQRAERSVGDTTEFRISLAQLRDL